MEELKKQWSSCSSERERARLEQEIWEKALETDPEAKRVLRREWLLHNLNASPSQTERRHTIGNSSASEYLWGLVDSGVVQMHGAYVLLFMAKKLVGGKDGKLLQKTIEDLLQHLRSEGISPEKLHSKSKILERFLEKRKAQKSLEDVPWQTVRDSVMSQLGLERVSNEVARERIASEFLKDFQAAFDIARRRIYREKSSGSSKKQEIVDACRVLGVDPPGKDGKVDMVAAKKAWRTLVRAYHPDTSGTNETRDRYERVMNAYGVLEEIQ